MQLKTTDPTSPRSELPFGLRASVWLAPYGHWLLVLAVLAAALMLFGVPFTSGSPVYHLDLDVYRLGAVALLSGQDLYGVLPPTSSGIALPFTYPPFAALMFTPMALLPLWLTNLVFTSVSLGCLALTLWIAARELGASTTVKPVLLLLFVLAIALEPVRHTLGLGQINLLLMALVLADISLGRGRWWQGSLIGLTIAIKLTPAVFLAFFLLNGRWRALVMGVLSALAATGFGFLVAFQDSVTYWFATITDPSRIGDLAYAGNQSLKGLLARFSAAEVPLLWFALCAAVGLSVLYVGRRLIVRGDEFGAVLLLAIYVLFASPVSWTHHWVWIVPALMYVTHRLSNGAPKTWMALLLGGAAIFAIGTPRLLPRGHDLELQWSWWQSLLGNADILWGIAFLVALAASALRRAPESLAVRESSNSPA